MGDIFRKYHSATAFQKYKQEAFSFTILSNNYKKVAKNIVAAKESSDVPSKVVEELRGQIRGLDKAFKLMFEDKASK